MKKILTLIMAVVMIATLSTAIFAVDKVDSITNGSLTVVGFNSDRTNAIELKSGDSYTFKFHNKSTGTNNWDNYVFFVTSEVGDAYKGLEQELIIIRADNYGWGGTFGNFKSMDGKTGDQPVEFEKVTFNFDEWKAAMAAGLDVEVVFTRNGNTITYEAKMGEYTMKLTAKSTKELPESMYVFLTGEKVELTNINATKNVADAPTTDAPTTDTPTTDAPTTGDTPTTGGQGGQQGGTGGNAPATGFATAAIAVVAISSGAYIVYKKRK